MTVLARGAWAVIAAVSLIVAFSLLHADHTGFVPALLLMLLVAVSAWRPRSGLEIVVAAIPLSSFLMSPRWNGAVSWAEVAACGAVAGLAIDATRRPRASRVPVAIGAPAFLFALLVLSAIVASVAERSLTLGPAFPGDIFEHVTQLYFVEEAAYPGLHAGMRLLEGLLLFAFAVRLIRERPSAIARITGAAAVGATLAGMMNGVRLVQSALRGDAFVRDLVRLARTLRWNVEYGDFNAAGSYFVMMLLVTAAMIAVSAARRRRRAWTLCGIVIASALWLTGSRTAYVAGVLALAAASALQWLKGAGRRRFVAAGALATAVVAIVAFIALAAPQRGNQHSSRIAADVRLQMLMVGGRMIAEYPVFGVGLGEFYQRSGDFATMELVTLFPVSMHENAHNNFVQIAAELGLTGGAAFVWLIAAGLFLVARDAARARDVYRLLVFAAVASFVITWLAGHPLLVPEAAYSFWIVFGAGVGIATAAVGRDEARHRVLAAVVVLASAAIVVSTPFHARAVMEDAELEHVGFGWSPKWLLSSDGIRYRSAEGHGTVFVPARDAFTFSINPRADRPVRLEIRLVGRIADIVTLAPGQWNDIAMPKRSERSASRFVPMDVRVLDGDQIEIWLTKVRPLAGR